jgi:hypothetical protein
MCDNNVVRVMDLIIYLARDCLQVQLQYISLASVQDCGAMVNRDAGRCIMKGLRNAVRQRTAVVRDSIQCVQGHTLNRVRPLVQNAASKQVSGRSEVGRVDEVVVRHRLSLEGLCELGLRHFGDALVTD